MSLRGHSVLIVESEITDFITALQAAVEHTGAQTFVVRDPYIESVADQIQRFKATAVLVAPEHRWMTGQFGVPVLLYERTETPREIVEGLRKLLAA